MKERYWWRHEEKDPLLDLEEELGLQKRPVRIEGYDISNIGAEETVASMVVFETGLPKKSDYRRFKIRGQQKSKTGPDDYAALEEVLGRRINRYLTDDKDQSFMALPDLVLIDGGKGQLSAALKVSELFVEEGVQFLGLAKREEEVFLPRKRDPVLMDLDQPGLKLLRRVRDEAHRFAVTHHRQRKEKGLLGGSALDQVPGLGPKRKQALLRRFGSPARVGQASLEELQEVPGVTPVLAQLIKRRLG
jgi:excinuclease ABC subunit C